MVAPQKTEIYVYELRPKANFLYTTQVVEKTSLILLLLDIDKAVDCAASINVIKIFLRMWGINYSIENPATAKSWRCFFVIDGKGHALKDAIYLLTVY